ncbi:hypothetical protein ABZX93_35620 [Streptomyces sp. NPDC006632]|uniref:hypothetical protein n=1 Tax=Streptomyces sp. NPDC006632 TaxID=3157182 RepID=UPI0033BD17B9
MQTRHGKSSWYIRISRYFGQVVGRSVAPVAGTGEVPTGVDRAACAAALAAHQDAQRAAVERGSELMRTVWAELEFGRTRSILTAANKQFGSWRIVIASDGATAEIEASGVPPQAWGEFVTEAVDRLWFHEDRARWKGAEDWRNALPGSYMGQSYRAQYADVLKLNERCEATELTLRAVDVRKAARGLYAMLTAEDIHA